MPQFEHQADAILAHHGFFWKNESPTIVGSKYRKIALLMKHQINLLAYHLPLDAHPILGNNIQLAQKLAINQPQRIVNSLVWQGQLDDVSVDEFSQRITDELQREPLIVGAKKEQLRSIAWCTGAAQNFLDQAVGLGVDAYLSGEISEQTPHFALENDMVYIAAGHHATERYGVQALAQHLAQKFDLNHEFIED